MPTILLRYLEKKNLKTEEIMGVILIYCMTYSNARPFTEKLTLRSRYKDVHVQSGVSRAGKNVWPRDLQAKDTKEWGGKKKERQSYNKTLNDIDKSSETGEYLARGYDARIKQALGKYVTVTE